MNNRMKPARKCSPLQIATNGGIRTRLKFLFRFFFAKHNLRNQVLRIYLVYTGQINQFTKRSMAQSHTPKEGKPCEVSVKFGHNDWFMPCCCRGGGGLQVRNLAHQWEEARLLVCWFVAFQLKHHSKMWSGQCVIGSRCTAGPARYPLYGIWQMSELNCHQRALTGVLKNDPIKWNSCFVTTASEWCSSRCVNMLYNASRFEEIISTFPALLNA